MIAGRKWPNVSILNINSKLDNDSWNAILRKFAIDNNITALKQTYYGIQADMCDLEKKKMATDDIVMLFIRLTRSIEKTIKMMYRRKFPSPLDNNKNKTIFNDDDFQKHLTAKRLRDQEFEKFLREASF